MARLPSVAFLAALPLLAAGCDSPATDVVATYKTHIGHRIIEAGASGWGRVEERIAGSETPGFYTLTTPEGRNLAVMRRREGWVVADSVDHSDWMNRNSPPPQPSVPKGRFVETGPHKAGSWTGAGYRMSEGHCGSWTAFAVLEEPGLEAFGRMFRRSMLYGAKKRAAPPCELQAIELMAKGVVLWVDYPDFTLEKLERRRIDPERFRPPSRILTRAELFRLLDSGRPKTGAGIAPTARQLR